MKSKIRHIPLEKLIPHSDNPNRMSRANFGKLMRHIKRTECYEPLVVRRHPQQRGCFQIINGHHRCAARKKLNHATAQAVVWDVSDEQTDILLATLNRLGGRDILDRKLAILRRLSARRPSRELAKLLPQTKGQLERLTGRAPLARALRQKTNPFAIPLVFFVSDGQQVAIEEALGQAKAPATAKTRAAKRAAALTDIATRYVTQTDHETNA
jgi:ParB/Sulfiredoxin domain